MNPIVWLKQRWKGRKAARVAMAYARTFRGEDGALVLADLAQLCMANESTFVQGDPHLSAHYEGMRRVFLHIQAARELNPRDLIQAETEDDE